MAKLLPCYFQAEMPRYCQAKAKLYIRPFISIQVIIFFLFKHKSLICNFCFYNMKFEKSYLSKLLPCYCQAVTPRYCQGKAKLHFCPFISIQFIFFLLRHESLICNVCLWINVNFIFLICFTKVKVIRLRVKVKLACL